MRLIIYIKLLTITAIIVFNTATAAVLEPVLSVPTLPQQYLATHFQTVQQSFQQRAILFLKGRPFKPWQANKPRKDILAEFDELNEWRFYAWYVDPKATTLVSRADFMVAQNLLEKGLYRKPAFLAFQYNQSDSHYNSSTIVLNQYKFLAMETPTSKTIQHFFLLLQNYRITQLVALSSPEEPGYAYWIDNLKTDSKRHDTYLNIPQPSNPIPYPVLYYHINHWSDNQSIHPAELLNLIKKVQKSYDPNGLLACHSYYGAGSIGTFLAGFLLISDIDKQIASGVSPKSIKISIENIVMQLSLQRAYMVRKPEQYVTLYRLVDLYLRNKQ